MGRTVNDLERQYRISNLEGVEERWRDTMLWLLAGFANVLEVKVFYFHLKEDCNADQERIKIVKRHLGMMRRQVLALIEQIKFASPLGPVLRDIRRLTGGGVGVQTIRRLEQAAVTDLKRLCQLGFDGMVGIGIRRDIAKRIVAFVRRRVL
jgi:hypothetical protein